MMLSRFALIWLIFVLAVATPVEACFDLVPNGKCTLPAKLDSFSAPGATLGAGSKTQRAVVGEFCWAQYIGKVEGRGWPSPRQLLPVTAKQPVLLSLDTDRAPQEIQYKVWGLSTAAAIDSSDKEQQRWLISANRYWMTEKLSAGKSTTFQIDLDAGQYLLIVTATWDNSQYITYSFLVDVTQ